MKYIKIICIFVIPAFMACCSQKPIKNSGQDHTALPDPTEKNTILDTVDKKYTDTEEYPDTGPGENGYYPDIDFYSTLSLFKDYLDSLNQRTPYSFSFNVPQEVQDETVIFGSLAGDPPLIPGDTDTFAVAITKDVVMYEKPFTTSPEITQINRGDVFRYDYSWDFPRDPDKVTDMNQKIKTAPYDSEAFMEYGDIRGLYVNELFNIWHHISNENISGWVFGAYLYLGTGDEVLFMRELYRRGSVFPAYQDYFVAGGTGGEMSEYRFRMYKQMFSQDLQAQLKDQYIAFENVSPSEYRVSTDNPDDMVSLYKKLCAQKMNPVLITTDFILHTLHLLFDRSLQDIEITYLFNYYKNLARILFDDASAYYRNTKSEKLKNDCMELMGFLGVALSLSGQLGEKDKESCDPGLSAKIDEEISLIENASGFKKSPLTENLVDYSQFKPRGHYTINELLKKYFKLMKWFGQIDFALKPPDENQAKSNPTRKALILTMFLSNSDAISFYEIYSSVLDYIVGKSDNPTPLDYFNLVSEIEELNTFDDLDNDDIVFAFIEKAKESLPAPRISDTVMVEEMMTDNPENEEGKNEGTGNTIPGGFRLVSERFTIDADIFTRLSSPRIGTREKPRLRVKTWDIAQVFGSPVAAGYLEQDAEIPGYTDALEKLSGETSVMVYSDWYNTFYSSFLQTARQLLLFPGETGVPFLDSPRYTLKNHLTFFSSYAELKHDTILYAKQPYAAEMGGFMCYHYVRDPFPETSGYIEPNLPLFYSLDLLAESLEVSPAGEFIFNSSMGSSFKAFFDECRSMRQIVEKEVHFRTISRDEYNYIFSIPRTFGNILLPDDFPIDFHDQADELRMAIVADIFTNASDMEVLEVATGVPSRIYMAVYDPSGGRRVCIGYTFTYYEFWQPMDNRLNDQQWRKAVYEGDNSIAGPPAGHIPDWVNELYDLGK